jgi:RND family efflux transporter MFP subunit
MYQNALKILVTVALASLAGVTGHLLWVRYMTTPWTRDGRVRADIISIAADVAGPVTQVAVVDNQPVRKGDVLFLVDTARYTIALDQARAALDAAKIDAELRRKEAQRRAALDAQVVSNENQQAAMSASGAAVARVHEAMSAVAAAELNLQRTRVVAPVDGYVVNLNMHQGDYALVGRPLIAIVDGQSFRVEAYFEETKLSHIRSGDPAEIRMLGSDVVLHGHVKGVATAISEPDVAGLLSNVNPTFHWVRLAQRIPVGIRLDTPPRVPFASGMTCTVIVRPQHE